MKNRELQNHKCKNTKCITQVEKYVPQSFTLVDKRIIHTIVIIVTQKTLFKSIKFRRT